MDLENSFLNNVDNNVDGAVEKVLKCLTELQALRTENTTLKKELANAELSNQNLVFEVGKLKQTSKDLKGQVNTAYTVINTFNKQQSERNSTFSHQTIKTESLKAENIFLTEQISIFQQNISKLTTNILELTTKCQKLEMNSTIHDQKFTNAWEFLQTIDISVKKLEENQNSLKHVIEKSKTDVNHVNESIKLYKCKQNDLKQENLKLTEKISTLLMKLPIDKHSSDSLVEECDQLTIALAYEKSKNIELSLSLANSVSNQNKIIQIFGLSCDKSVQTEII